MARYVISNRLTQADQLQGFDQLGYRYDASRSSDGEPTFVAVRAA